MPDRCAPGISDLASCEWLIDAQGCDARRLVDVAHLRQLLERVVADLDLHVIAPPLWHQFPAPGGVTGSYLLAESHLTCHTWPEFGMATINLFCCRPHPAWPWDVRLKETLGAQRVDVRVVGRGGTRP